MRTRATRISWLLPWAEVSFSDVCEVVLQIAQPLLAHAERNKGCYSSLSSITIAQNLETTILVLLTKIVASAAWISCQVNSFITFVKYLCRQQQGQH